jgi:hypothetical protein
MIFLISFFLVSCFYSILHVYAFAVFNEFSITYKKNYLNSYVVIAVRVFDKLQCHLDFSLFFL